MKGRWGKSMGDEEKEENEGEEGDEGEEGKGRRNW